MIAALLCTSRVEAVAGVVVDPFWPWPKRIDTCATLWFGATSAQQGTMTYRQFTTKCVGGKTALPFDTTAVCRDGARSAGDAPGGICADNGGVVKWLK